MASVDKLEMLRSLEEELAWVQDEQETLIERETALEQAINGLQELIELEGGVQFIEVEATDAPVIRRNTFAKMGILQAAIHYLRLVGENQTNREIVDALIQGGKKTSAKRFPDTVRSILLREAQNPQGLVFWSGQHWGLREWST